MHQIVDTRQYYPRLSLLLRELTLFSSGLVMCPHWMILNILQAYSLFVLKENYFITLAYRLVNTYNEWENVGDGAPSPSLETTASWSSCHQSRFWTSSLLRVLLKFQLCCHMESKNSNTTKGWYEWHMSRLKEIVLCPAPSSHSVNISWIRIPPSFLITSLKHCTFG